jgi:hypothetical protein
LGVLAMSHVTTWGRSIADFSGVGQAISIPQLRYPRPRGGRNRYRACQATGTEPPAATSLVNT